MRKDFVEYLIKSGVLSGDHSDWVKNTWRPPAEPIGSIAFSHGVLSGEDVDRILEHQRTSHDQFGQIALQMGALNGTQLEALLEIQQMRTAVETAEAVALTGMCPLAEVMGKLGQFLVNNYDTVASHK